MRAIPISMGYFSAHFIPGAKPACFNSVLPKTMPSNIAIPSAPKKGNHCAKNFEITDNMSVIMIPDIMLDLILMTLPSDVCAKHNNF
jgi:hypothetical protein